MYCGALEFSTYFNFTTSTDFKNFFYDEKRRTVYSAMVISYLRSTDFFGLFLSFAFALKKWNECFFLLENSIAPNKSDPLSSMRSDRSGQKTHQNS